MDAGGHHPPLLKERKTKIKMRIRSSKTRMSSSCKALRTWNWAVLFMMNTYLQQNGRSMINRCCGRACNDGVAHPLRTSKIGLRGYRPSRQPLPICTIIGANRTPVLMSSSFQYIIVFGFRKSLEWLAVPFWRSPTRHRQHHRRSLTSVLNRGITYYPRYQRSRADIRPVALPSDDLERRAWVGGQERLGHANPCTVTCPTCTHRRRSRPVAS